MIQRLRSRVVLALGLAAGCRGEAAAPSEPPRASAAAASEREGEAARTGEASAPGRATNEAPVTTTPDDPTPAPAPAGPPLAAEVVVPRFQGWWKAWSREQLAAHPLKITLDERVAAGGTVKAEACDALAEHVRARAPAGSAALLFGDPAALRGLGERCWWLHHDGMMGPGLGAALASDGQVLVVWVVVEG